jgi:hypothetical protein
VRIRPADPLTHQSAPLDESQDLVAEYELADDDGVGQKGAD